MITISLPRSSVGTQLHRYSERPNTFKYTAR